MLIAFLRRSSSSRRALSTALTSVVHQIPPTFASQHSVVSAVESAAFRSLHVKAGPWSFRASWVSNQADFAAAVAIDNDERRGNDEEGLKGSIKPLNPLFSHLQSQNIRSCGQGMDAFKAFKACAPIAWSPNLYITLVRGIPGTRRLHRRTLEALRLRKCNRTVMRYNTPTVRGMIQQVKRLVVVETEEMYKARKEKLANHRALRPPLVINHSPASASGSSQQSVD